MKKPMARVLAFSAAAAVSLSAGNASALLPDDVGGGEVDLVYFYPYPTSYRQVDPGYAFDDDPLEAFVHEPYEVPIEVKRESVGRVLVKPRMSFVHEMVRSTDVL